MNRATSTPPSAITTINHDARVLGYGGLIAIWDRSDQWHQADSVAFAKLLSENRPLASTELIFHECANASARRSYRSRVNALRKSIAATGLLIEPTIGEFAEAWDAYDRGEAADAGLVDQVSFAVMRRLGIGEAFTNDRHFQAAGFVCLF